MIFSLSPTEMQAKAIQQLSLFTPAIMLILFIFTLEICTAETAEIERFSK